MKLSPIVIKGVNNRMKIRTKDVCYYFQNVNLLEVFIRVNQDKILYTESMADMINKHGNVGFIFSQLPSGRYDWDAHLIGYVKRYMKTEIITYLPQRTE